MPIPVYLDSSDYSTLSDSARLKSDPRLGEVLRDLLGFRDAGTCEFRYSAVHVLEMTPVDPTALEKSLSRIGLMQDLCGEKCLIPADEIDRYELLFALC